MRLDLPRTDSRTGLAGTRIVPMINIVFLLLIFFLMVAEIAPPDPVAVSLPRAAGTPLATGAAVEVHLGPDGVAAFGTARGDDALQAAAVAATAAQASSGAPATRARVVLRADARADGAALARALAALGGAGPVALVTLPE